MTELTPEEQATIESILEGLALAVRRSNDFDSDAGDKLSAVKLEKFVYYALEAQGGLDQLTHSWYLAGAKADTPDETLKPAAFRETYQRVAGTTTDQESFRQLGPDYEPSPEAERYAEFFTREYDIHRAWITPSKYFLLDFYREEAPERFHDLYVAVQKLRIELENILGELNNLASSREEERTLSDFGAENTVTGPNSYEEAADLVSEIHMELASDERLRTTVPQVRAFTDILEDAFLALGKMDVERIDSTHLQAFGRLKRFFFYQAWRFPAHLISIETSRGPREEQLRVNHARDLEELNQEYGSKIENLRSQVNEASLKPTAADYPTFGPEEDDSLDALIEKYVTSPR